MSAASHDPDERRRKKAADEAINSIAVNVMLSTIRYAQSFRTENHDKHLPPHKACPLLLSRLVNEFAQN